MVFGPVGKWVRARTESDAQELYEEYLRSTDFATGWSRRQTLLWAAALLVVLVAGVVIGFLS